MHEQSKPAMCFQLLHRASAERVASTHHDLRDRQAHKANKARHKLLYNTRLCGYVAWLVDIVDLLSSGVLLTYAQNVKPYF